MKLCCKVVEDLLPMYYDGVCSQESATLIEEHLRDCPQCRHILTELHTEIEIAPNNLDDLKPLSGIQTEWKKEKRHSARKGACITLAAIFTVFAIWTLVWYFGYAVHYDRLAGKLTKVTGETAAMTTASHSLAYGEYMVVLKKPAFLGGGGFVHIGDKEGMVIFLDEEWNKIGQSKEIYLDLFFYPQFGGGYQTAIVFDDGQHIWWAWLTPELTYNYDLYDSAQRPREEIVYIEQLLAEHREEIKSLTDTAQKIWNIRLPE